MKMMMMKHDSTDDSTSGTEPAVYFPEQQDTGGAIERALGAMERQSSGWVSLVAAARAELERMRGALAAAQPAQGVHTVRTPRPTQGREVERQTWWERCQELARACSSADEFNRRLPELGPPPGREPTDAG